MKSYSQSFNEICEIGSGTYGKVYKVQERGPLPRSFAIKKIYGKQVIEDPDKNSNDIEVKTLSIPVLSRSSMYYVVEYFDSWVEDKYLFIQMELCSNNLRNIIREKSLCFKRSSLDAMNSIEYFICSQLFKELLECVQYLHGLRPSIIHRDLKPENILITEYPRNGRFLKLCDFGLVTYDGQATLSHTRGVGTPSYMAPEVINGQNDQSKYNTKADVYSLAIIAQELFEINLNSEINPIVKNTTLKSEWICLVKLLTRMMNPIYRERPTCASILSKFIYWGLSNHQVQLPKEWSNRLSTYKQQFFIEFLMTKIQLANGKI